MKTTSKNNRRNHRKRLGFEALEKRQLLAADLASAVVGAIDTGVAEQPQVQVAEVCSLEIEEVDQALEAALGAELEVQIEAELANQNAITTEVSQAESAQSAEAESLDPRNLDLSDSIDGFVGTIGPESPTETLRFTASANGLANVVVANSFEDSSLLLTATSAEGGEIEFELLSNDGFDTISFEVNQGESYELTVASTQPEAGGQFQVTVGFEEFVDQHFDVAGANSTELVFADQRTELTGKLESPEDIDTFRATAPQGGEVTLELDELEEDRRLNLNVSVTNASGAVIAEGATNEFLRITFDVVASEEFFVAVSGGEGQEGDYRFTLNLDPSSPAPLEDSLVVDEILADGGIAPGAEVAEVADEADEAIVDEALENDSPLVENEPVDDATSDQAAEFAADTTEVDEVPTSELVGEEVAEIVGEIEEVFGDANGELAEIVDAISEEVSEVEGASEVEGIIDQADGDLSEIVDTISEGVSEIEGIVEIADDIGDVIEDTLADTVVEEAVDQTIDQVVGEFEDLPDQQPEVVEVIDANEVAHDAIQAGADTGNEFALSDSVAIEQAEPISEELPSGEAVAGSFVDELVGEPLVVPVEDDASADPDTDGAQELVEVVDDDSEVGEQEVTAVDEDEDDREFVWAFGPDSFDSFFESLSEAGDELGSQNGRRLGGWGYKFLRALQRI